MFKKLPEIITNEWRIIRNADSLGGILKCLPSLLKTLENNSTTSFYISALDKICQRSEKELHRNYSESIQWVKDKIEALKKSRFGKHSLVEHTIVRAEEWLNNSHGLPPSLHLDTLLTLLTYAVSPIVAFGSDPVLEDWVKIKYIETKPKETIPKSQTNSQGISKIAYKNKLQLADLIGYGVAHWEIVLIKGHSKNDEIRIERLMYGTVQEVIYPPCVHFVLEKKSLVGLKKWKELRDSDESILYEFLKVLSKYGDYGSELLPNFLQPRNVIETEQLCIQGKIGPYLSRFASLDSAQSPLTREQVLNLIDSFLLRVENKIIQRSVTLTSSKIKAKNDPRVKDKEKAIHWLKEEWNKNKKIGRETMIDRLTKAVSDNLVGLSVIYERSTYKKWAKSADPASLEEKLRRPKAKNR